MNSTQNTSSSSRSPFEIILDLVTMVAGALTVVVMALASSAMGMTWLGVASAVAGTAIVLLAAHRLTRR